MEIFENWGSHGHRDWKVREKEMSSTFTIVFERKEFVGKES